MTPARFIRSLLPQVVLTAAIDALVGFLLVAAGSNPDLTVLVCAVLVAGEVAVAATAYLRRRRFWRDLAGYAAGSDYAQWLAEVIDRPDFLEGQIAYDALRQIAKAANDDVASQRRQTADYREYIETWVHEAKSPLAAAHLMVENLSEAPGGTDAYAKLISIDDELRRVEGYIDQALFYARSEAVDRDYLIRKHELSGLVAAALKANAPALIAAHVAPVQRDLGREVFTDEKWIEFILGQLIQNSVKYARPEGASITFSGRLVDQGRASEAVELEVRDNGCGVSEADLPRVFDKGFTGANGRTGKRSTGIGLYLVKRLCDKIGVGVSASSGPGEWFAVTLRFSTNKFRYFD